MKYIRTKDGRIIEEHNLGSEFKQTIITIKNKKDNKELEKIVCDNLDNNYLEMVVVGEYCKCHKINPKDIKYETNVLLNEDLKEKESDTIEELCDEFVGVFANSSRPVVAPRKINGNFKSKKDELYAFYNLEMLMGELITYGAIWTKYGLRYVAKLNNKGELELL